MRVGSRKKIYYEKKEVKEMKMDKIKSFKKKKKNNTTEKKNYNKILRR
jgi:hypothetical protein